jgi:hypothetical protein
MFLSVDGGCSQIYSHNTSQGPYHRCFLALMVGTPGSIAPVPPRGPTIDVCYVGGGHSRISVSTSLGARCRRFLVLMVGASGSKALAPPREPAIDVLQLGRSHSQTSGNASQGTTMSSTFLSKSFFGSLHY